MAGSNLMLEAILSTGLTADPIQNWREDIPYVWAEQQYGDPSRALQSISLPTMRRQSNGVHGVNGGITLFLT